MAPQLRGGFVKPSTSRIVLRHAAYGILGAIGLSGVGAGASQGINQLLLSPANPPIRDVIISLAIVNGAPNIEPIHFRIGERGVLRLGVLVRVLILSRRRTAARQGVRRLVGGEIPVRVL